jgi:hypothetical protein
LVLAIAQHHCHNSDVFVALKETLTRFPTWEVDHDRAVRLHTSTVRGYEKLPIII